VKPIPEIEALTRAERDAHKALTVACEKRWPKGTRVGVILRSGQIVASKGTVLGFDGYMVRVKLEADRRRYGRKIDGWHSCKDAHYTAIVWEETEGGAK